MRKARFSDDDSTEDKTRATVKTAKHLTFIFLDTVHVQANNLITESLCKSWKFPREINFPPPLSGPGRLGRLFLLMKVTVTQAILRRQITSTGFFGITNCCVNNEITKNFKTRQRHYESPLSQRATRPFAPSGSSSRLFTSSGEALWEAGSIIGADTFLLPGDVLRKLRAPGGNFPFWRILVEIYQERHLYYRYLYKFFRKIRWTHVNTSVMVWKFRDKTLILDKQRTNL